MALDGFGQIIPSFGAYVLINDRTDLIYCILSNQLLGTFAALSALNGYFIWVVLAKSCWIKCRPMMVNLGIHEIWGPVGCFLGQKRYQLVMSFVLLTFCQ